MALTFRVASPVTETCLFLWPKNAEGTPVRIRTAPRTPKAGSSLVARTLVGAAEADGETEADADADDVEVGGIVTLTLTTVGSTLGTETEPEREKEVKELVESEIETLPPDWLNPTPARARTAARTARRIGGGCGKETDQWS